MPIVDEHHAVSDENFVFDRDAGTNERVTRNFAALADMRIALHLDERADLRCVSDAASVKIYERPELYALAQNHVGRGAYVRWKFVNRHIKSSWCGSDPQAWRDRHRLPVIFE